MLVNVTSSLITTIVYIGNYMSTKAKVTFPIELVWAAVAAADRVNQGEYIKIVTSWAPAQDILVNSFSVQKRTNRDLTYSFLEKPDTILAEDHELGRTLHDHYKGLLFRQLGAGSNTSINTFLDSVANIVAKTSVGAYEVAVMASLPSSYRRELERDASRQRLEAKGAASKFIGEEGSKHVLKIVTETVFYSAKYNSHIVTATAGTDIVKFFTSKDKDQFPLGQEIVIKGSVKRHGVSQGVNETWFNRVSVLNASAA
jgi:hypothetical protein